MENGTTVYTSVVPSEVKAQDVGNALVLTVIAAISVNSHGKPNSSARGSRVCTRTGMAAIVEFT
ncbi:MAG TPA: hypothetical protein VED01_18375 [Burkholderiales bacterium]|nr:hypothetical protein [Burkholderiales bacterium]